MVVNKNIKFSSNINLENISKNTQILMITKNGKYQLGKVVIDRYNGHKLITNNYSVLLYAVLEDHIN